MAQMTKNSVDLEDASTVALQVLTFLASSPDRIGRFLALTGTDPQALRSKLGSAEFQAAILDHLMADESLLLTYSAEYRTDPEMISACHRVLTRAATENDA